MDSFGEKVISNHEDSLLLAIPSTTEVKESIIIYIPWKAQDLTGFQGVSLETIGA